MRSFVRGWSSEEFIAEQVESFESLCAKRASESVSRRDKWFVACSCSELGELIVATLKVASCEPLNLEELHP